MIQRVGVVGAGTMGAGIAQLCAQSGFPVKLFDPLPGAVERGLERIGQSLDAAVLKGRLTTQQAERARHAIAPAASLDELAGAELVIEAAPERLALKRELFQKLAAVCPDAILATNTSSLSVAAIAEGVPSPERVLGMHFFNPPVAMKLVELVRAPKTSPAAFQEAWDFVLLALRKTPVDCKDTPGFIVNRVMRPYYVESQRLLSEGGLTPAFVDERARSSGAPMGPFELMDLIGLDVNLAITESIYEALGRPERFSPPALQRELVGAGELGRKTAKGFYLYEHGKASAVNPRVEAALKTGPRHDPWPRLAGAVRAEAERVVSEGAAGKSDIDLAIRLAMNFPKGPFEWQLESPSAR